MYDVDPHIVIIIYFNRFHVTKILQNSRDAVHVGTIKSAYVSCFTAKEMKKKLISLEMIRSTACGTFVSITFVLVFIEFRIINSNPL